MESYEEKKIKWLIDKPRGLLLTRRRLEPTPSRSNNRMVMNFNGVVDQVNNYYPSGLTMAESPARGDQAVQPYKFENKELDRFKGLDFYDFEARQFSPDIPRFWSPDPLAWKRPWESQYCAFGNDPVNRIDPDGKQFLIPSFFGMNPVLVGTNTPLLGATDLVKAGTETGATRTAVEVATKTSETTGGKTINLERINAGKQAETEQLQKLGVEKNTESFTRIDPKTGKEGTTTPDGIKNGQTTEIKNLKEGSTQNLTKQLRLQKEVSNGNEQIPKLHLNENVKLSKPLQDAGFEVTRYSAPHVVVPQDNTKIKVIEPIKVLNK